MVTIIQTGAFMTTQTKVNLELQRVTALILPVSTVFYALRVGEMTRSPFTLHLLGKDNMKVLKNVLKICHKRWRF